MSKDNIISLIKAKVGEGMASIVDYSLDLVPYAGDVYKTWKINRAERRIKEHSAQLKTIQQLYASQLFSAEFIKEKIGPIVLSDLIEDHEDAKVVYILNGFENVFITENYEESLIINYYDTLRNLRYDDVRKLYFYAAITDDPFKEAAKGSSKEAMSQQIFTKLERLYLVRAAKTWGALQDGPELLSEEARKVELTSYGRNFIKFISKDFDEGRYEEKISKYEIQKEDQISKDIPAKFG